jgi:hypothetical protein
MKQQKDQPALRGRMQPVPIFIGILLCMPVRRRSANKKETAT